jgi:hypothetical protein
MKVQSVTPFLLLLPLAACGGDAAPPATTSSAQAPAASQTPAQTAAPVGDDTLAPLFGIWSTDVAQCTTANVLKISRARFDGPGSGCDITGFNDGGNGTVNAALTCGTSGQKTAETIRMRPIFTPTGEGIDLVYVNRDNLASTVLRCPEPKP